jgi:hypothetical protein
VLAASAPGLDGARVGRVLRANLHWVAYVVVSAFPVLLFNSDHERHLLPVVPPLLMAVMHCLRAVGSRSLRWALAAALTGGHAYLVNTFAPLAGNADYARLWGYVASERILRRHLEVAVLALVATLAVVLTRMMRPTVRRHRAST